jgi:regulator of protease activity HflC (stomatin/prohibitin superfamily)
MVREIERRAIPGLPALLIILATMLISVERLIYSVGAGELPRVLLFGGLFALLAFSLNGVFVVNPNEARVITLFGRYRGSVKTPGLWWVNPFTVRRRLSLRVRNFETGKLKVNDSNSNPIEIAAVVVWRVVDTAEALFEVNDYENYVQVQSESALRTLASGHPYDAHAPGEVALSTHTAEVSKGLLGQIQERLGRAGVQVTEARISHLAYAPEIASAMLQRQQASAVIAARQKIVEGAVGMVEMALEQLSAKELVRLDDERRAAMVSNLLVVLCAERAPQPVLNTGTLYQ